MNTNYSYPTSLPPYLEDKTKQRNKVLRVIKAGKKCIKAIAKATGIPDSTVAGRVNDLVKFGVVKYDDFTYFDNRKRKRIILNK